jgi:hypothetical protein
VLCKENSQEEEKARKYDESTAASWPSIYVHQKDAPEQSTLHAGHILRPVYVEYEMAKRDRRQESQTLPQFRR